MADQDDRRRGEFMQALTTDHTALQSAAVVVLALVVQVSRLGAAFFVFAFAILPVVFFLGLVTFGRLLQTGVEDVIYARAISRIRSFYSEIDPSRADYFAETSVDQVGLAAMGLWNLRWQQFLAAAATIAVVNAVVGGAFVALTIRGLLGAPVWVATVLGAAVALLLALAFLRYQWRAWTRSPWRCRCERGPAPAPARIHEFCLARRHLEKAERRALRVSDDREAPAREVHRRNQFARAGLRRGLE